MLDNIEILKFLASFSIIVIFIYSIYYFLLKSGFNLTSKGTKNIKIIESVHLSRNKLLYLIKVKETLFLLSLDEKGIKKIKEWQDEAKMSQGTIDEKS